jgi:hypothetical protein
MSDFNKIIIEDRLKRSKLVKVKCKYEADRVLYITVG